MCYPFNFINVFVYLICTYFGSNKKVVLDGISLSRFGATSWSFPAMNVWFEVINSSYREGGWHAEEMSEPA